jgi:hypothetical protein
MDNARLKLSPRKKKLGETGRNPMKLEEIEINRKKLKKIDRNSDKLKITGKT